MASDDHPAGRLKVMALAPYTIPAHALLPALIWAFGRGAEGSVMITLLVVHFAFPALLVATYRLWRGQGGDLLALLFINHLVTFTVTFVLLTLAV